MELNMMKFILIKVIRKKIFFPYENDFDNPYFRELRNKYPIDSLASSANSDLEKVREISSWVYKL